MPISARKSSTLFCLSIRPLFPWRLTPYSVVKKISQHLDYCTVNHKVKCPKTKSDPFVVPKLMVDYVLGVGAYLCLGCVSKALYNVIFIAPPGTYR